MPRLAFIWHAAVMPAYRKLLEEVHAASGAELHLIVPPRWPEAGRNHSAPAGKQPGYWTHVLPAWFIGRHYLYFMPTLARTLRAIAPDLIYCYAGPYWVITFWTLWIVRRYLPATRVVFVSDQTLFKEYPFPFCWMERWVLRYAHFATSCDMEGIRRLEQKGFPGDRAVPVPLGFDAGTFFAEADRIPDRDGAAPLRILYAGRLLAMKGLTDLVDACALLNLPYELDIAGDGPEREQLGQRARQLGVEAAFRGALPAEFVAGMMRNSDVLVLPSRTIHGKWKEQFGRVLVEAMACGCVPVGSDSGAIPGVIGPAGLTYPEGDVAALAACLNQLGKNRERLREFRRRALERAQDRYSWKAVARLLWSTVERAMALPERS